MSAAKQYVVQLTNQPEPLQFEAEKVVTDGMGTRLYDADGGLVASFADGQVQSVYALSAKTK